MAKIIFTVTNDLNYDQRMTRIAGAMAGAGYRVLLTGRELKNSSVLQEQPYQQKRLRCIFNRGFLFYAEYNLRLFFFLLFQRADIICAIDLDTILPVYFVTAIKQQKRVYDAHEIFTEQKEVLSRPRVHALWLWIERFTVPKFSKGYTVNLSIVHEFAKRYGVQYSLVRNLPKWYPLAAPADKKERWILYQGSVNEGRCFETLIPAMKNVNARLVICGKGNFYEQTLQLVRENGLEDIVILKGYILPEELKVITQSAYIGLTLFEKEGMNQYYSLANRFFDYAMAGIPQVCVNYPEYAAINQQYEIAALIDDTNPETIATALNNLLANDVWYIRLVENCMIARENLNWENEKYSLLNFYKAL